MVVPAYQTSTMLDGIHVTEEVYAAQLHLVEAIPDLFMSVFR